jgi:hypothetical protein
MKLLPDYLPPNAQRASLAVGVAPLAVLVTFTLLVSRVIAVDTAFAVFGACTVWVVHEMSVFQRRLDRYNRSYVEAHLSWRTSEALLAMVDAPGAHPPTRDFVHGFVRADRQFLRDGQTARLG